MGEGCLHSGNDSAFAATAMLTAERVAKPTPRWQKPTPRRSECSSCCQGPVVDEVERADDGQPAESPGERPRAERIC